jgi:hypothetical protein
MKGIRRHGKAPPYKYVWHNGHVKVQVEKTGIILLITSSAYPQNVRMKAIGLPAGEPVNTCFQRRAGRNLSPYGSIMYRGKNGSGNGSVEQQVLPKLPLGIP